MRKAAEMSTVHVKSLFACAVVLSAGVVFAMPTAKELAKARPVVAELTDGMDAAAVAELVGQAETEASRYHLIVRTAELHVKAKAYDAAAATLETLYTAIADMTPATVVAEIQRLARGVAEKDAPRLLALLKLSRALDAALKDKKADARTAAELRAALGQWDVALALFASQKGEVAKVAEKETELKDLVSVADFWWAYEPSTAAAGDAFKKHAVKLYQTALDDGTITAPLKVALVKKRIEQMKAVDVPDFATADLPTRPVLAPSNKLYLVVDLSDGPESKAYKVSYLNAEPKGGWTDEYKSEKLVLRHIKPGTFIMGEDQKNKHHRVTLTKPFYIGVFEVTQRQWELVMGTNPSEAKGALRPADHVTWNAIRGNASVHNWPTKKTVDSNSFVGRLAARTGLAFDLPTSAQWEYACRAGTRGSYNNGSDSEETLRKLGRFLYNQSESRGKDEDSASLARHRADGKGGYADRHTTVGSYQPNAWGLYDMHGNVFEWCLDWYDWSRKVYAGVDPEGLPSGSHRVVRSGCWWESAPACASPSYGCNDPNFPRVYDGFRLALPLAK